MPMHIGDWIDIGELSAIPVRGARTVPVAGGEEIAIFRTGDDQRLRAASMPARTRKAR
jgi:nitrite reductase/ring-hydroxylating ferredoxin subunit